MRNLVLALTCGAALLAPGCGTPSATNNTNGNTNGNAAATTSSNQTFSASNRNLSPVSAAHGDNAAPPSTAPANNSAQKPGIDTAALDARIEKAEAKAKGGAQADKLAAAAALVERANVYRDAGQPSLYKFALGDYRRALRYQPDNTEAREKMNEIVSIYQSMGRPVPENGNEP
ncbi:MAG TPA: hypothetical protein VGO96_02745 [Pyrinomonadaceae bacterium]|jgi:hypothetical protein|nr:hypothetical protein [Pyrinomonadaceae bacterium]